MNKELGQRIRPIASLPEDKRPNSLRQILYQLFIKNRKIWLFGQIRVFLFLLLFQIQPNIIEQ